ncbi:hypothetical protein ACFUJR_02520 [Streptomyces sp. NPDC057271]|uniref:hypothetical protein n=1 Tax=unclassified Streptomyces TaxID=2593676 RepID=UPI00362FF5B2
MRRKITTVAGTIAAAAALTVAMSGSAYATSGIVGCSTTGAYGDMAYTNYHGPAATIGLKFSLEDTLADKNGVRIRLVSRDVKGAVHYWPWRTHGSGTVSTWKTTASHDRGLFEIAVEVARFYPNGKLRNSCIDWS